MAVVNEEDQSSTRRRGRYLRSQRRWSQVTEGLMSIDIAVIAAEASLPNSSTKPSRVAAFSPLRPRRTCRSRGWRRG